MWCYIMLYNLIEFLKAADVNKQQFQFTISGLSNKVRYIEIWSCIKPETIVKLYLQDCIYGTITKFKAWLVFCIISESPILDV
jgi:hypothetical protein